MPLDIITIGGSMAGLMASVALRRLGHNVRILERAPTPLLHDQGAGIVAGGDIPTFMSKYDRTETPMSVTSKQRMYLDKAGKVMQQQDKEQHMTSWDLLYHMCRVNFDMQESAYTRGRLDQLADEGTATYQHGCKVIGLEEAGGSRVKVLYKSTLPGDEDDEHVREVTGDFVIVADGSSSVIRKQLCPEAPERTYAGYVAFRGTVPELELSQEAASALLEKFTFYHSTGTQILGYAIPGKEGSVKHGERLVNWVWYVNIEADSDTYRKVMTDTTGATHRYTLPTGGQMRPDVWEAQKMSAKEQLPPQFAELVTKTQSPFVQAITDLEPPHDGKCWRFGGKAVVIGDALAGFRPHTAASTAQAALCALELGKVFAGEIGRDEYEKKIMSNAVDMQKTGVFLGNRSQFGSHPLNG